MPSSSYELVDTGKYTGPIVIKDSTIYSDRLRTCQILHNAHGNDSDNHQRIEMYKMPTYPFKRYLDHMLITAEFWSCDRVPLPKHDYIEGFYCLALRRLDPQTSISVLYVQDQNTGQIIREYPLTNDNNHSLRYIDYDIDNRQLFIYSTIYRSSSSSTSTSSKSLSLSMIIFKLFPMCFQVFVAFTIEALKPFKVTRFAVFNQLLLIFTQKTLYAYHLNEIFKINGYDCSCLSPKYIDNHLEPNIIINQLSQCLLKIDCMEIEFIQPIPSIFYCKQFDQGSVRNCIYDIKLKNNTLQVIGNEITDDTIEFKPIIYFHGNKKIFYYITYEYIELYQYYKSNKIESIRRIHLNELTSDSPTTTFIDNRIIESDYLDNLDVLLLLTVHNDIDLQLFIINDLHTLVGNKLSSDLAKHIRCIELNEIKYTEDRFFEINWDYNFIMITERYRNHRYLYVYQLKF